LRAWWSAQHGFARRYKYVTTSFGRRYPLPDIDHEMKGFRAKAERNSVNGPVQGTSADIMKLAMALLYKEFKKRGWLSKVLMTITIHDELVFEIQEGVAEEAVEVIEQIMTINTVKNLRKNPIPLKVDLEFGQDWTVPYNLTEMRWNKCGEGVWTSRLARIFPNGYAHYLEHGGTPVDGAPATPPPKKDTDDNGMSLEVIGNDSGEQPSESVPSTPSQNGKFEMPETGKGVPCVHTISQSRLSYGMMEKLAQIIVKCQGRGTQPLILQTEHGESLWDGPDIYVSAVEFRALASFDGV